MNQPKNGRVLGSALVETVESPVSHYITDHEVMLPDAFVDSMRARWWRVPSRARIVAEYNYEDFTFWRE